MKRNCYVLPYFRLFFTIEAKFLKVCKHLKTRLQTAQNKTIRFVFDLGNRSHVGYDCFIKVEMDVCTEKK